MHMLLLQTVLRCDQIPLEVIQLCVSRRLGLNQYSNKIFNLLKVVAITEEE